MKNTLTGVNSPHPVLKNGRRVRRNVSLDNRSTTRSPSRTPTDSLLLVEFLRGCAAWRNEGKLRGVSKATQSNREGIVHRLTWHLTEVQKTDSIDRGALTQFLLYLREPIADDKPPRWNDMRLSARKIGRLPVKPETVATYHRVIRTLFRFLVDENYLEYSPMEKIRAPLSRRDQIESLSDENIGALLRAAEQGRYPARDCALMLFLLSTGARISEACGLRVADLDGQTKRVLLRGKGGKSRLVPIGKIAWRAMRKYLEIDPQAREASDCVFLSERPGRSHGGLTRYGALRIIANHKKRAGITAIKVSPHIFRHTFALRFLRAGESVYSLKERLGHTSLTICMRYLHLSQSDMDNTRKSDPVDDFFTRVPKS